MSNLRGGLAVVFPFFLLLEKVLKGEIRLKLLRTALRTSASFHFPDSLFIKLHQTIKIEYVRNRYPGGLVNSMQNYNNQK